MNLNVNDETLLFDGPSYEPFLLKRIEESTIKIFISCYIIENDTFGEKVLSALSKKAKEGVKVFLIADGFGSWEWINDQADQYRSENFEIRVYHPMTWKLLGISIKNIFWGMNRRNHHKLFIFDQNMAMNGSRNINNNALSWRETSVFIVGPSVATLCALFNITWRSSHNNLTKRYNYRSSYHAHKKLKGSEHILSTHKFSLRRKTQRVILEKLLQARQQIQITTPYFFPTAKVFEAILKKANDGISITVLLPLASDVMVSKWITQYHYERLMRAGVQIHEYTKAILHAKSTLVDDWALIGTSNMNRRSVYRDLEIDYIVSQPYAVKQILTQFESDLKNSVRVTSIPKLSIGKKIVVLIATKLFSSWF